jgi:hypothetical protein
MMNNFSVADELKIATGVAGTSYSFFGFSASEIAAICTAIFMVISIGEKLWKIYKEAKKDGNETTRSSEPSSD